MTMATISGPRVHVAEYERYEQAARAVDYLADRDFPVEGLDIVGVDLRSVERVSGRMSAGRAAAAGAGSGAWFGSLIGLFLALFATTTYSFFFVVVWGILLGLLFGAVFGALAYLAAARRHQFTSTSTIIAGRYHLLAEVEVAERARDTLARLT